MFVAALEPSGEVSPEPIAEVTVTAEVVEAPVEVVVEVTVEPAAEESVAEVTAAPTRAHFVDEVEEKRLAAIGARRKAEAELVAKRKADAIKKKEPEVKVAAVKSLADIEAEASKAEDERGKHGHPTKKRVGGDEAEEAGKAKKAVKKPTGTKKAPKVDLSVLDEEVDVVPTNLRTRKPRVNNRGKQARRSSIKLANNSHGFKRPTGKIVHEVEVGETIVVADLAQQMGVLKVAKSSSV